MVSVLLRSLDRPQLQEALDSVAAQTWSRLELVVAPARPGHRPLPQTLGAHPLRMLATEQEWPRSANANRALDAAQGELLLFLDDDDWLMPDHIERLVQGLQRHPQAQAAYTGVAMVDAAGQPLGQVFDLPWDSTRLLCGNLAPIHAVLFRAGLRQQGCRFDESLDRYEDWDFWLQVARRTAMLHVPGVSAVYRIHPSSGVHQDSDAQGAASACVHEAWLQRCGAQQRADLMRRAWAYDDAMLRLESSERYHAERLAGLQQGQAQLHALLQKLQADHGGALDQLAQQRAEATHWRELAEQARTQLAQVQQELAALQQELAALQPRLAQQTHLAQSLTLDLEALRASHSWRLTAPLRWLASRLPRAQASKT